MLARMLCCVALVAGCGDDMTHTTGSGGSGGSAGSGGSGGGPAQQKIQHVIVIMQENRSFDHYFGTFPGADGIPMNAQGVPTVCNHGPNTGVCVKPYHLTADKNAGGPHNSGAFTTCVGGGAMSGFIANAENGRTGCADPTNPQCTNGTLI